MKKLLLIALPIFSSFFVNSQVISVTPSFPTIDDNITIVYDATKGNAALTGVSPIYAHTGVITSTSTSPTNWQYTKGTWGTADPSVLMTSLGSNKFSINIDVDVFYAFPVGTIVNQLAMVFRNTNGSIVGRSDDGTDIYYPVYPNNGELFARIFTPNDGSLLNIGDQMAIHAESNLNSNLSLFDNGVLIAQQNNATTIDNILTATSTGNHLVELVSDNGSFVKRDTLYYIVNPAIIPLDPPAGTKNGINYLSDTSLILQLYAPFKNNIYVIGDFNNWLPNVNYHMNRGTDNATWWIEITNLTPNQKYGYQYYIDGVMKLADPLSTLILDPNNDNSINTTTYPNRLPYPTGKTSGYVTVIQPGAVPYVWQNTNFIPKPKKDLIIYELLVRDFVSTRNYKTLTDTLNYLQKLGISAIELMPIGEFEGNESWGYNPMFHMALDKYYGTPDHLKTLIDSCHARGIAVIMDIALNHAFGENPMVNMYWDAANNQPAANNPWFNAICPHQPYCWGYDLNHEAQATKDYLDRVNSYWLQEFHIDGFRFDYSKGFVNNANAFSQVRIDILKRMADTIWKKNPQAYVILEHWADNNEEIILSDYGMMLWGNMVYNYDQANMGFTNNSNLSNGIFSYRGWNNPNLVTYMESHDEERLIYESKTYGDNSNPNHNARDLYTALGRAQATAVIMLTTPGPKMIWQFGELGYDISINNPCRVCNKPILWNYAQVGKRKQLYDVYAATLVLRNNYPTFQSLNYQYSLTSSVKRFLFNEPSMNAVVLANFAVTNQSAIPSFQSVGTWYEYFTGDSLVVTNVNSTLNLLPGEYRIYTSKKLPKPVITSTADIDQILMEEFALNIFPVPANDEINVSFISEKNQEISFIIIDNAGKVVLENSNKKILSGENIITLDISKIRAGSYHLLIKTEKGYSNKEFIKN